MKRTRTLKRTLEQNEAIVTWTLIGIGAIVLAAVVNVLVQRYGETLRERISDRTGRRGTEQDGEPGLMDELLEHNWQGF